MEEAGTDNKAVVAVAAETPDASPELPTPDVSTNFTFTCNVQATVISTATDTSSQLESASTTTSTATGSDESNIPIGPAIVESPAENLDAASAVEPAKAANLPEPCSQECETAAEPEASKVGAPSSENTGPNEVDAALPLRVQAGPSTSEQEPATTILERDHSHKTECEKVNCREALQTWYTALDVRSQDEYIKKYGDFAKEYFERR
ncbi:hypothetical protein CBER1_10070 [Cercospora berteroae]|uniref:Uncharacterized protein n=1 Tax=Cercospora berteroae TaxID=357750 RepID=A0A2S6C6M0_9PEZI|nr:hypothetical protein CBER1_10070 [Cercospora berteroae]